ncbi:hypothetical protein JHK82_019743 [Glycine max]|uniref:Uncharacterized protein n=1 Tax=Glycine max TaxID=3847 RepID=C6TEQ2_SOYBN|nr:uncharacterized protein LOC100818994 [Glycine max]XP_028238566.1 uncharacterized protein LOC114417664 [Glycine soja]ACU20304.1 unknown [Glycine max]KAG5011106.1 hypothetical protein JHK87_019621 [Glycine soja]KAG5038919.1 hypothetical protein JHK86_019759 [Glycine max]KAG5144048.1 hypothetical protein JHK82_019743 [Glycine max]KAH1088437.1 hypothetical protein GYH30_019465 [Glycine max]|eukprot:NP_001351391.1 uncharacterized protein LOC100818994 [Glycine max]
MAPPAAKLREIGLEGFALWCRGRRASSNNGVFPASQGRWVVQVPNDEMEELALNSNQVAARFGGIMLLNCFKGTQHSRCGTPIRT